jgi:hypothetical protein
VTFDGRDERRLQFRVGLMMRRGVDAIQAFKFAEMMWIRDQDHDSRRLCLECKHLRRGWICDKGQPVLADVLQRCSLFSWEMPK